MTEEKRELGKWWIWIFTLLALSVIVFSILGMLGKLGGTFMERKVFEQSYQRSEGLKSQMNTWQAQLASINSQILNTTDKETLSQLKTQKAMLEIQIAQTQGMK